MNMQQLYWRQITVIISINSHKSIEKLIMIEMNN